jgi:hypothetical protein
VREGCAARTHANVAEPRARVSSATNASSVSSRIVKDIELQTRHTVQGHELADAVNAGLRSVDIPPGRYVAELMSPEGQSTVGGAQSLQHLRLVPRLVGFPALLVGTANHVTGAAALRSFECVDAIHKARFGTPVPLDEDAYCAFLAATTSLLEVVQLTVTVVEASHAELDAAASRLSRAKSAQHSDASSDANTPWLSPRVVLATIVVIVVLFIAYLAIGVPHGTSL